jgi:hypothetical protein
MPAGASRGLIGSFRAQKRGGDAPQIWSGGVIDLGPDYAVATGYDEAPGVPRRHYRLIFAALMALDGDDLAEKQRRADLSFLNSGITFTVYAEGAGTSASSRSASPRA